MKVSKKQKIAILSLVGIISAALIFFYCKSKTQINFYLSDIAVGSKPKGSLIK
jgi:hypothetical protein